MVSPGSGMSYFSFSCLVILSSIELPGYFMIQFSFESFKKEIMTAKKDMQQTYVSFYMYNCMIRIQNCTIPFWLTVLQLTLQGELPEELIMD